MELMKGRFWSCQDTSGNILNNQILMPGGAYITKDWCLANGGNQSFTTFNYYSERGIYLPSPIYLQTQWVNQATNFDDIGTAMLSLYEIASLEIWEQVMLNGIDSTGAISDNVSFVRDSNPYIALFFEGFVVIGAFFLLNLFVGVVIDKFNELKEKAEGLSVLLTPEQQAWVDVQKLMAMVTPRKSYTRPKSRWRAAIYNFILSKRAEELIMGVILVNILQMAVDTYNEPYTEVVVLSAANIVFTFIFFVEMVLKMVAIGPKWYFRARMNQFDFVVVTVSIGTILADYYDGKPSRQGAGAGVNLLRVARVARLVRLIPKAKGLRTLVQTLVFSLPALFNVGAVLFMFIFIFAVMGMQLFGTLVWGVYLDKHGNFETFPNAMFTLFRTMTGGSRLLSQQATAGGNKGSSSESLAPLSMQARTGRVSCMTWRATRCHPLAYR